MTDFTNKDFNDFITNRFTPLEQTLDRTVAMLSSLTESLHDLPDRLSSIEEVLDNHTKILDAHTKLLVDLSTDKAALTLRLERYDKFMKIVADKLNLDLRTLLDI